MHKIVRNIRHLLSSFIFERVLSTVSFIIIAKLLVTEDYGSFTVALAFSSIFSFLGDLGMSSTLIREVSRNIKNKSVLLVSFIKVKIVFTVISGTIAFIIAFMLYDGHLLLITLSLTLLTLVGNCATSIGKSYFQAIQSMEKISNIVFISSIFSLTGVLALFILDFSNLFYIVLIYSFGRIFGGIYSVFILKSELDNCKLTYWDSVIVKGIVSFSIGGILLLFIPQIPPLILERGIPLSDIGVFGIAQKVPIILYSIPAVVAGGFYPNLFKFSRREKIHSSLLLTEVKILVFIGTTLSIPFILHSEYLITMAFGDKWFLAGEVVSIYIYIVVLQSINFPLGDSLSTVGKQKIRNIVYLIALIISLVGYSYLTIFYENEKTLKLVAVLAVLIEILITVLFLFFQRTNIYPFLKVLMINGLLIFFIIYLNEKTNFISELLDVIIYTSLYIIISYIINYKEINRLFVKRRK